MSARDGRSGPARRAVLRWAWRLFRREWRQQLLTVCVLTFAVAAAVWFSTASVAGGSDKQSSLGTAKALIRVDTAHEADVTATLSTIRARFGDAEVVAHSTANVPGLARTIDVRAQDPNGEFSRPTLALRSGRYPTTDGEVALTDAVAEQADAHIGGSVTLGGETRTVVGIVENPRNLDDEFALVSPSSPLPNAILSVLVGVERPKEVPSGQVVGEGFDVIVMGSDDGGVITLVIAAVTVSMALVGLVATSSFVVIAKRRQRQLGMLGALGATERHIRLALVANGAAVGAAAATVGAVLGIGVWWLTAPIVERASAHRIDRFDIPWALLAVCVALAMLASIGAAWWPARTVSRVPVVAAIAQRPSPPLPVHRSAVLSVLVLGSGVAAIAMAKPRDEGVRPWLLILGLLAVIAGTVLVAPAAIRLLALTARRLPLPSRLALRDLARFQARAAAALAAISLALGIAVATLVVAKVTDDDAGPGNLPPSQLVVSLGATDGPFATTAPTAAVPSLDAAAAAIAAAIPGAHVYSLDVAMPASSGSHVPEPVGVATPIDHGYRSLAPAYVATPELLALFGVDSASIDSTTDMISGLDGVLLDVSVRDDTGFSTAIRHDALSSYADAPQALITHAALQRHGWTAQRAGWLIDAPGPITSGQVAAARRAAAGAGLAVDARDVSDSVSTLGRSATIGGGLVALAILAMTIGLIRGESAGDVRTLVAVGAPGATRRAIAASASAALAVGGVLLASAGAYLAVAASYRSDLAALSSPPITNLLVLWLGLPALAAVAGWLLAGRQPTHVARQLG